MGSRRACVIIGSLLVGVLVVTPAMAQQRPQRARGCDELFQAPGVAWRGTNGTMTLEQLASYVAPVLWFSPDEPTLQRHSGRDIRTPTRSTSFGHIRRRHWRRIASSATRSRRRRRKTGRSFNPARRSVRSSRRSARAAPLLLFKNVSEPLSGGYLVNRLYTSDKNLRDWGWMVMYTPSGSRWFDQYVAGGVDTNRFENEDGTIGKTRAFVAEAGVKLRFRAPNRILGSITNF